MPHDPADESWSPADGARLDRLLRDLAVANDLPSDAGPARSTERPPPGSPHDRTPPPGTPPHGYG